MTNETLATPFGAWPSSIAAEDLVVGAAGLTEVICDGSDIWFCESRPEQGGRVAIMRWRDGSVIEITPPDANVRTRVHEYGGGAWWVADEVLWYSDDSDQRLRRLDASDPDGAPLILTPAPDVARGVRFADGRSSSDGKWFFCVRETHSVDLTEPRNEVVAISVDDPTDIRVVATGADFYASPRISADGCRLAWVQWDHPNMPWDDTTLWVADFAAGQAGDARPVAGDGGGESIVMCDWVGDELWAVSDSDEWWNLFSFPIDGSAAVPIATGSFEVATPAWVFGLSRWVHTPYGAIVARTDPGGDTILAVQSGLCRDDWSAISALSAHGDGVVFIGARHDREPEIVRWDPSTDTVDVIRSGRDLSVDSEHLPDPEHIVFASTDGEEAHGWFYRPAGTAVAPAGELPPLLVLAHGGPTSRARTELSLALRYWTTRGFAVVDVDYRGSTGYGRTYRQALQGRWGVADVDDCIAAAQYLADSGLVDADRLLIKGSSAGGLTVLGALVSTDLFAAGGSRYGVADLRALAAETHKFEARYCDRLIAPWPEGADIYDARSPVNRFDDLETPMIVLQGDADVVVPPSQAEALVSALKANDIPHASLVFKGVGHGFRDAETIVAALQAELSFFCQVLGVAPADDFEPISVVGEL